MWAARSLSSFTTGIVLLLLLLDRSQAVVKRWISNWNVDDASNWQGGSPRCADHAVLPESIELAFVGSSVTLASLTLPLSGGLVFGEEGVLTLGVPRQRGRDCPDTPQTMIWTHSGVDRWWDPSSWSLPEALLPHRQAVPDVHRVPCTTDIVVLPDPRRNYAPIHFEPPAVTVAAVTIAGKNYSTSQLTQYSTVNVSGQYTGYSSLQDQALLYAERDDRCSTGRDCKCTGDTDVLDVVCRGRKPACPQPSCQAPITMTGFCCPSCGADLTMPATYSGTSVDLQKLLEGLAKDLAPLEVGHYVGLMSDDRYHLFLAPQGAAAEANFNIAVKLVTSAITAALGQAVSTSLLVSVSGPGTGHGISTSSATAAVVTIIILVALGLAVYFILKRGLPRMESSANFQFRRMSMVAFRRMSRVNLSNDALSSRRTSDMSRRASDMSATSAAAAGPSYNTQSGLRFSNPVFSKSTASLAAMPIDPEGGGGMVPPAEEGADGISSSTHENPMYSAYMHMSPDEKKATDYTCQSPTSRTAAPAKPPRVEEQPPGVVRFSQLGTIDEDLPLDDPLETANNDSNSGQVGMAVDGDQGHDSKDEKDSEAISPPPLSQQTGADRANETRIVIDVHSHADNLESSGAKTDFGPNEETGVGNIDILGASGTATAPKTVSVIDVDFEPNQFGSFTDDGFGMKQTEERGIIGSSGPVTQEEFSPSLAGEEVGAGGSPGPRGLDSGDSGRLLAEDVQHDTDQVACINFGFDQED